MATRKEIMIAMYDSGMTYQKIGEIYGISRQAVQKIINNGDGIRLGALMKIPYVGLRLWMLENRVTISELRKRLGTRVVINGRSNPQMETINKILEVTGLSYEECFNTERTDGSNSLRKENDYGNYLQTVAETTA